MVPCLFCVCLCFIHVMHGCTSKGIAMLKLSSYSMPQDCLLHIYNVFILSYFNYCIIIWGNAHKKYLNPFLILQKHAIRLICKAFFTAHCTPLAK